MPSSKVDGCRPFGKPNRWRSVLLRLVVFNISLFSVAHKYICFPLEMLCVQTVYNKTNRRRYIGQQPGTKSARGLADKPLVLFPIGFPGHALHEMWFDLLSCLNRDQQGSQRLLRVHLH